MAAEASNNEEPDYDELLSELDFSPRRDFSENADRQLEQLFDKLSSLNYSQDVQVKVMVEAMRRFEALYHDDN